MGIDFLYLSISLSLSLSLPLTSSALSALSLSLSLTITHHTHTQKWSNNLTYNQSIRRHYVGNAGVLFSACLVIGPEGEGVLDITAVAATVQGNGGNLH